MELSALKVSVYLRIEATGVCRATAPSTTLADTVTWTKGRHSIRTGAEIRYNENNYVLNYYVRGQLQEIMEKEDLSKFIL